jgi:cytidylate kinase
VAKIVPRFCAIAVSGQSSSGKSTLCRILAAKLSWKHVDIGAEFRRLASLHQLEIEQFGSVPDKQLIEIDKQITERIHVEPYTVWDGRLACYLSKDVTTVFKVFCTAPIDTRSQRLSVREKISLKEADTRIEKRDAEEKKYFSGFMLF